MLTSPITVTIDGVAHELDRINQDNFTALYQKKLTNRELQLTIRHSYEGKAGPGQMERHQVDLRDITWSAEGIPSTKQVYTTMRLPRGTDTDGIIDNTVGLNAWLTANVAAITAFRS